MGFLPFWPALPVGSPADPGDGGGGLAVSTDTDYVRVAAPPPTDPTDQGYVDQQPGAYGDQILCAVDDLRARRSAGLVPAGTEDFKITSVSGIGVIQADQAIAWVANHLGPIDPPFIFRSVNREIPPGTDNPIYTVYATGRD